MIVKTFAHESGSVKCHWLLNQPCLRVAISSDPRSAVKAEWQHGQRLTVQVGTHGCILRWIFPSYGKSDWQVTVQMP